MKFYDGQHCLMINEILYDDKQNFNVRNTIIK